MTSRFSASTCVTGGRMSADTGVMDALMAKGAQALAATTTHGRHVTTELALVTAGHDATHALALGLTKTYFREPLCFRCNYFGHMKRDCPFHAIL